MRHTSTALALLALAGALSACGGQKAEQPAEQDSAAAPVPQTPAADPAAGAAATGTTTPVAVASPPAGFFQCRTCHSVEPGKNGIGPTLAGIVGSKAGAVPGFNFSPALKNSGITWDRATLEQWLAHPTKLVPGTRMVAMVPDPVRRKEIIDYLETLK